ncbi:solute carrier family 2, facilitated glucose transporter member 1-like isoform X2 [Planococcus citri]|uniref:solute carrier family 2, facilitated glucose transporter member 1-like isoform X2 n=1 Tax=Planococcus citri TaxID=170843 RepID=UPI0031F74522
MSEDAEENEKIRMTEVKDTKQHQPTSSSQNLTGNLLFATFAAAVGSAFQHGYNTGVVNAPQKMIEAWIGDIMKNASIANGGTGIVNENTPVVIYAAAVAIFCFGGMIGGLMAGAVAETLGRKWAIILNNILVFIAALLMGLSRKFGSYYMLIIGRLFIGVNSGLNAGLIPMYLSEISPTNLRGMIGSSYQLVITISILLSQILGMKSVLGSPEDWPILFSLIVVPAALQVITMPFCKESPRYLSSKSQDQSAIEALQWFRGTSDVNAEFESMKSEFNSQKSSGSVTLGQMMSNPMLRIPMVISIVIMLAQQLSGINAVIFYSTSIFDSAKLSASEAQVGTIAMGAMNVAMTIISSLLVEAAGRKTLLLIGFGGMFVDTVLLFFALENHLAYFSIILVVGFVVIFATGPGSIPWFLVSELFMQNARPLATSIAVGVNWTANFFVGLGFPILHNHFGSGVFIIFAVLQFMFTFFIYKKVPETKNKSTEEISAVFRQMSYES